MQKVKHESVYRKWSPAAKIGMIVYLALALVLFYSCYYADFYETGLEGVRFWDILLDGQIRNFYTQIFLIGDTQYIPLYDFPMYLVFALWNFPLWIVQKVSGIDIYHSVPCLMWMKSMLLAWLAAFLWQFGKLTQELTIHETSTGKREVSEKGELLTSVTVLERKSEGIVLFLTSMFFVTGLVVLGQYDVISLTFMMLGLRAYVRGDDKKFVLWFAIGAPFKYFSILVYVPLVLLKEKKISKVLLRVVSVILPILFFWIVVPYGTPELVEGCSFSGSSSGSNVAKPVYDALFVTGSVGFGTLFVYVFAWIIFLVLCYAYQKREEDNADQITIYACFIAFMIQFTLGYSHPYWLILMEPFMLLILMMDESKRYINLLLETVGCAFMALGQIFYYTWCFNSNIVSLSFWQYLLPSGIAEDEYSVMTVLAKFVTDERLQDYASGVCLSIYAACILLFTIFNFPLRKIQPSILYRERTSCRWLVPIRAVVSISVGSIPVVLYFLYAMGL